VCLADGFDEPGRDPHARSVASRAAFEEIVGLKRFADLASALEAALEDHRGPSCDDRHLAPTHRTELGDQLFREPVAEILLAAVVAQIAEREHEQAVERRGRRAGRGLPPLEPGDEAIPPARHGLDEPRLIGFIAEGGAQPLDRRVEAVLEVDERSVGPETLPQFVARDDVAGALEHQAEDFVRLILQADAPRPVAQLAGMAVELERRESKQVRPHASSLVPCPEP
jgi:hypothetical protein